MHRTSARSWVTSVLAMFAARGVDVPRLVAAAGIEPARLDDPAARFDPDEVSLLWHHAVLATGDATLGLDRDLAARFANFDLLAYALASSPDLRSGLAEMGRFGSVVSNAATFELHPAEGGAWLVLGGLGFTRPVPRQRYAFGLLSLVMLCQWAMRRPVRPLAAEFPFAQPPEVARYREVFGCPLRFGRPENRLLLARADLDAPIPSRNPSMLVLHEKILRDRVDALGSASTAARVGDAIVRRLHLGEPRREEIAASLAMGDRTLQRRLQDEHTSFQQLLDGARRELAHKYLAEPRYSLADIAGMLGFADEGNFFRASRRWFGEPPGHYRRRIAGAAEQA